MECVRLVTESSSDARGGWQVLHQKGVNRREDCIMYAVVPPLLQSTGAGIEDVKQSFGTGHRDCRKMMAASYTSAS